MRVPVLASMFAIGVLLCAASCSSSASSTAPVTKADAGTDADAAPKLVATCVATIVECVTTPTQPSPTVNDPAQCNAPAYDAYATDSNNEQVEAACNDFCVAQNPDYADAGANGAFIGCNQTAAEQALGTGAFHCVCAP